RRLWLGRSRQGHRPYPDRAGDAQARARRHPGFSQGPAMMRRLALPLMLLLMPGAAAAADGGSAFRADKLTALAFHQHPGAPLPRDLRLTDATGHPVRLGDLIAGKPVVLALDYFRCRTLCGFVLANLADALAQVPLRAGR